MAHRDFDEEYKDQIGRDGHTFVLAGIEFTTKGHIPPAAFLHERGGVNTAISIIRACLDDEQRQRFNDLLMDYNAPITAEQVDQIGVWLLEQESGNRPTKEPASSGPGAAPTTN